MNYLNYLSYKVRKLFEAVEEERVKKLANWQAAAAHKQLDEAEIKICFQLKGRLWRLKGKLEPGGKQRLGFSEPPPSKEEPSRAWGLVEGARLRTLIQTAQRSHLVAIHLSPLAAWIRAHRWWDSAWQRAEPKQEDASPPFHMAGAARRQSSALV